MQHMPAWTLARRVAPPLLLVTVALGFLHPAQPSRAAARREPPPAAGDTVTQVEMRNVHFHVDDQIALRIHYLRGEMRSKQKGSPIFFDDKNSFVQRITNAEVGLTASDLTLLLNRYVFNYPGSPLKHLRVTTAGRQIKQTGIMHKVVDIPFEITAELAATPDGQIRIHPVKTRIFNVDGDGLMRALHLKLDKLLDLSKAKGAKVKGNDLFLDPDSILPPPTIQGRVTAVRVEGDEVVQEFGGGAGAAKDHGGGLEPPERNAPNYMFYRYGTLRFGKLVMLDAEMQIIDRDTSDAFDFNLDHYKVQLVAGYSRSLPDGGLKVFMPDYDDASRGSTHVAARERRPPEPARRPAVDAH
jgi:hypothetical protein